MFRGADVCNWENCIAECSGCVKGFCTSQNVQELHGGGAVAMAMPCRDPNNSGWSFLLQVSDAGSDC